LPISAARVATRAAGPIARSRSHTTVSPDRLPASSTERTAPDAGPPPLRPHDNTDNRPVPISAPGNAACRSDIATRPEFTSKPGHRSPSRRSRPTSRSIPPPSAPQSTSRADVPSRAARAATAPASTELPAPPRAPTTATTAPCSSARSEEHTSELQSRFDIVCRLLLVKKNNKRGRKLTRFNRLLLNLPSSNFRHIQSLNQQ